MLALHGNPTWSFYWRALIAAFSDRYRVIVPDHLGAGRSSKPQDAAYRLLQHVDN
ncbi:MAG: alpha/beta fold hydrolase, partial [Vulcanococcus sp.]